MTLVVRPVGQVSSSLTGLADAPRQGDEGAPVAWPVFDASAERARTRARPDER